MHALVRKIGSAVIIGAVALVVAGARMYAQDAQVQTSRLDYAIPDAPGFKIIDDNPSTIIRPGNLREITVAVQNVITSGVLPENFATEFSPMLVIAGPDATLQDYRDLRWLYSTRISVATKTGNTGSGKTLAGIGIRTSLIDEGDPRNDKAFIDTLAMYATAINQSLSPNSAPTSSVQRLNPPQSVLDSVESAIQRLRERKKERSWNEQVLEVAAAVALDSPDSLTTDIIGTRWNAWLYYSNPIGNLGHAILSGTVGNMRSPSGAYGDKMAWAAAARFYIGGNDLKFHLEGQFRDDGVTPDPFFLLQAGGEVALGRSFWVEFALGRESVANGPAHLTRHFSVRWGMPEVGLP